MRLNKPQIEQLNKWAKIGELRVTPVGYDKPAWAAQGQTKEFDLAREVMRLAMKGARKPKRDRAP